MEIGLEEVGVVFAGITVITLLVGVVAKWAKRSAHVDQNAEAITSVKRECAEGIAELRTWVSEELAQLKLDYATDDRTLHTRIDRQRDRLDQHIQESTEVHKALSSMTTALESFTSRLDRFEQAVNAKFERLNERLGQ